MTTGAIAGTSELPEHGYHVLSNFLLGSLEEIGFHVLSFQKRTEKKKKKKVQP